jgi:hypothetical protein
MSPAAASAATSTQPGDSTLDIGGQKISWDAVLIAAAGIAGVFLLWKLNKAGNVGLTFGQMPVTTDSTKTGGVPGPAPSNSPPGFGQPWCPPTGMGMPCFSGGVPPPTPQGNPGPGPVIGPALPGSWGAGAVNPWGSTTPTTAPVMSGPATGPGITYAPLAKVLGR